MTRIALYARVSTKEQDDYGTSLTSQLERMREYAAHNGYTIVAEEQEDFSGRTADRPRMNVIKEMAAQGKIDALLTYARDRYARSRLAGMMLDLAFRTANVKRLYVTREESLDTPQGHLRDGFDDLMHEYEVENFVERSQRGKIARAQQGLIIGMGRTPIYGYKRAQRKALEDNAGAIAYVENCTKLLAKEQDELAYLIEEAKQFKDSPRIGEQYRIQIEQCNERIEILERERATYEEQVARAVLTDEEIARKVRDVERLRELLRKLGSLTFEQRRRWIEILNIHIVLGIENGRKYVDIVWYETTDRRYLDEEEDGSCGPNSATSRD